jgi:chromosome segregation ATPase
MDIFKKQTLADAVAEAVESLLARGADVTVRGVQELVGGNHSVSTIHAHLKKYKARMDASAAAPPQLDDLFRPAVRLMSDLVKSGIEEGTRSAWAETEAIRGEMDILSQRLNEAEAEKAAALEKAESSELAAAQLRAEVNQCRQALDAANAELERARAALERKKIREEDYQQAKLEAAEALKTAAMFEGRLKQIDIDQGKIGSPPSGIDEAEAKKSKPKAKKK